VIRHHIAFSGVKALARGLAQIGAFWNWPRSFWQGACTVNCMIRKLSTGGYRLYSKKKDASGKRKNLGTFKTREEAEKHERAVQYFKHAG
jgi:hypothetical protein